jgi:hypothetical protein
MGLSFEVNDEICWVCAPKGHESLAQVYLGNRPQLECALKVALECSNVKQRLSTCAAVRLWRPFAETPTPTS